MLDSSQPIAGRVAALEGVANTNPRRFKSHADLLALLQDPKKEIRIAAIDVAVELDFFEASGLLKESYVHETEEEVRKKIEIAVSILDIL